MLSADALGPRERIVDKAATILREAILTGELKPGQQLVQTDLSMQLQVSRTPLREAIRKLEQEGLVTLDVHGRAVVRERDAQYVFELYRLREAIDGLSARLCAERVVSRESTRWIEDLEQSLRQMEGAIDDGRPDEWALCNVRFHAELMHRSRNRPLESLTGLMRMSAEMFYPAILLHPDRTRQALNEHREILSAVRGGHGDAAEEAARRHIRKAIDALPNEDASIVRVNQP